MLKHPRASSYGLPAIVLSCGLVLAVADGIEKPHTSLARISFFHGLDTLDALTVAATIGLSTCAVRFALSGSSDQERTVSRLAVLGLVIGTPFLAGFGVALVDTKLPWPATAFLTLVCSIAILLLRGWASSAKYTAELSRKLTEHGLLLSQASAQNSSFLECAPFPALVTDSAGLVTVANAAAHELLGLKADDLIGKDARTFFRPLAADQAEPFGGEGLRSEILLADPSPGKHGSLVAWNKATGSSTPVELSTRSLGAEKGSHCGYIVVVNDLTDRTHAEHYIQHLASHDLLTGLPNRALLRDRLQISIDRARRSESSVAIMMIDLDHFRRVNDGLGIESGDRVLCTIGDRLTQCVRKADTIARVGGDEFILVAADLEDPVQARVIAGKLLEAISQPIEIEEKTITLTASIGISLFPLSQEIDALLTEADLAMNRRKARGRDGFEIYKKRVTGEKTRALALEAELRGAIARDELSIVYQPQIRMADHSIVGVEALLRWNSAKLGAVMPTEFIPIAEETGLIVPMSEWILRRACQEIGHLQAEIGKEIALAVNISPRQFQQSDFPTTIEKALRDSSLRPDQLELEITESLLMIDSEESLEIMQRVRTLGVHFAIDDFGTGFSNMGYITRFAVDRIKIDRSFISKCDTDTTCRAVTSTIIALSHSLGIEVVAEGVETSKHVEELMRMGCDQAQGYLYSKPLSLAATKSFAVAAKSALESTGRSGVRMAFLQIQGRSAQVS